MPCSSLVVGASLGGLTALKTLLGGLPPEFGLPVAIAQHRDAAGEGSLAAWLHRHSSLAVAEAEDKEEIVPGTVRLAPAGYHLLVDGDRYALSTEGPVRHARPSIDLLFESAAESCGTGAVGLILTGTGPDGSRGLAAIKLAGGLAIVQDPASAECPEMPSAAIAATAVDHVLPLAQIAPFLLGLASVTEAAR
ncbi:MAG: chemotaxis protein CheB [Gemmatimonadetes bacterium]|nr:chemotaxis protein CheB [Gemmatimonadota bacterium]